MRYPRRACPHWLLCRQVLTFVASLGRLCTMVFAVQGQSAANNLHLEFLHRCTTPEPAFAERSWQARFLQRGLLTPTSL